MPRIDQIIDANLKSGTSQSGKPWTLMKVQVGDNQATIFAPASVGDEVKLNYNQQYKNYTAEKMTAARKERDDILDKLDEILRILKSGASASGSRANSVASPVDTQSTTEQQPEPPSQQMDFDQEVDLSDSPF